MTDHRADPLQAHVVRLPEHRAARALWALDPASLEPGFPFRLIPGGRSRAGRLVLGMTIGAAVFSALCLLMPLQLGWVTPLSGGGLMILGMLLVLAALVAGTWAATRTGEWWDPVSALYVDRVTGTHDGGLQCGRRIMQEIARQSESGPSSWGKVSVDGACDGADGLTQTVTITVYVPRREGLGEWPHRAEDPRRSLVTCSIANSAPGTTQARTVLPSQWVSHEWGEAVLLVARAPGPELIDDDGHSAVPVAEQWNPEDEEALGRSADGDRAASA